jgi:hypothetical protein
MGVECASAHDPAEQKFFARFFPKKRRFTWRRLETL